MTAATPPLLSRSRRMSLVGLLLITALLGVVEGAFVASSGTRHGRHSSFALRNSFHRDWVDDSLLHIYDDKIPECLDVLENAANKDPETVQEALETLDKTTTMKWNAPGVNLKNASHQVLSLLNGNWRMVLASVESGIEYIPKNIQVLQTFDNATNHIEHAVYVARAPIVKVSGTYDFGRLRRREIESVFDTLTLGELELELTEPTNETSSNLTTTTTKQEQSWIRRTLNRPIQWIRGKLTSGAKVLTTDGVKGDWKVFFTPRHKRSDMQRIMDEFHHFKQKSKLPEIFKMEQTFDLISIPTGIRWDVYLGDYMVARLLGTVDAKQLLDLNVNLDFFRLVILGVEVDLVGTQAGEWLTCIFVDDDMCVTRGQDGYYFLWRRDE